MISLGLLLAFLVFTPVAFAGKNTDSHRQPSAGFKMLTEERFAALPPEEREAWIAYLKRSRKLAENEVAILAEECRQAKRDHPKPAPAEKTYFKCDDAKPAEWYASSEARDLAEAIVSYQTPAGGWSKAVSYRHGTRPPGTHWTSQRGDAWHYCGTLDNGSTTEQIDFLARFSSATNDAKARESTLRGIEWLLSAQYPNGGWPQNYPVERGYHEAITLNDNALQHALELVLAVSEGAAPYLFCEPSIRQRAGAAFQRGLACVAAAQIRVNGQPTVWCAQHDPVTLEPVSARTKEPPSFSGAESATLLKFLMRSGPTTDEMRSVIRPALHWLNEHRITGIREVRTDRGRTDYVPDPQSREVYWARFYDLQTGKPVFAGAQDGILYPTFQEMAAHNEVAYDFLTSKPQELFEKEIPRWEKRFQIRELPQAQRIHMQSP